MKTKVKVFDKILTKNKLNKPRPNTAQKTIPITSVFDDGIIETRKNEFSKTLQFTDVNYNSAKDEEQLSMFTKYCNLLNYFNSSINVQVTINNKIIDKKDFENKILSKYKNDDLDKYRKEWNDNLIAQTKLGRNDTEKEKYITVSIKAADISQARSTFNRIENEIVGLLKSIGSYAKIMPINKRLELLNWAYSVNGLIIEDDYDGIIRYDGMPIPCLQGLDNNDCVIYLGAFSKTLLPSLRISYMIIPKKLIASYQKIKDKYTQSTSKIDQIVLSLFMKEGHMNRHLRRIRRIYKKKNTSITSYINKNYSDKIKIINSDSGFHLVLEVLTSKSAQNVYNDCKKNNILIEIINHSPNKILLSFNYSGIVDSDLYSFIDKLFLSIV